MSPMIWLFGVVVVIIYQAFYAGMKADNLFYTEGYDYSRKKSKTFSWEALFGYSFISILIALTWMLSLPIIGIYKLGRRFAT